MHWRDPGVPYTITTPALSLSATIMHLDTEYTALSHHAIADARTSTLGHAA